MQVLLSIKPEFVDKIFNGEKRFEYRKSLFTNKMVKTVLVYATMPVGKVVGEFEIDKILEDSPNEIWDKTQEFSGIKKTFFDQYFAGREKAFAIQIADYQIYETPKTLIECISRNHPPQSFCYV